MVRLRSPQAAALTFGILTAVFLAAFYVVAWTEPSVAPPSPDPNVAVPLNSGSVGQSKKGNLALNTDNLLANGLLVPFGSVGIGTASPASKLHVSGGYITTDGTYSFESYGVGVRGAANYEYIGMDHSGTIGRVYTYAGGTGTLRPLQLTSGSSPTNGIYILTSGNVGIGTTGPGQKLTVAGTIESTSGGFKFPDGTTQSTAAVSAGPQATGLYGLCVISNYNLLQACYGSCTASSPATCNLAGVPSCPFGYISCGCPVGYALSRTGYGPTYFNIGSGDYESNGYRESCYKN